jgi:hypothetical protein
MANGIEKERPDTGAKRKRLPIGQIYTKVTARQIARGDISAAQGRSLNNIYDQMDAAIEADDEEAKLNARNKMNSFFNE